MVVMRLGENTDTFLCSRSYKVIEMQKSNYSDQSKDQAHQTHSINEEKLSVDEDLLLEQILENINNTPIGQVLKKIAMLPEVRQKKVLDIRRQLTHGRYELNERLDIALDRVLEDLTA